mmetsp:Transcript_10913/g.16240  ORF Transcript_10913/g.16240 Transcript_10913/m.16240 type:complete len:83 (+) Transcript_10913:60-308(+)
MPLSLLGKFKGEGSKMQHLILLASELIPGFNYRMWMDRMVLLVKQEKIKIDEKDEPFIKPQQHGGQFSTSTTRDAGKAFIPH